MDLPDTEIDWTAYMQQIQLYLKGETNYANIKGDTGPLVYPGLHVYIYRALHAVTDHGNDIFRGQLVFALLYLISLSAVMATYRQAKVPPYIYPLLIMSKRLHSIFMLRMFNDCFTVLFLFLAIYSFQRRWWHVGSLFYSCGLGVKMNLLLVLPPLGFIFLQALGIDRSVTQTLLISQTQVSFIPCRQTETPWADRNQRACLHMSLCGRIGGLTLAMPFSWTGNSSTSGRLTGGS
jgi:alpha-1,3-mannosyltransferase